jgi:hypothetical protein
MDNTNQNINFLIWNAQSISPKRDETFNFLLKKNIHVALINETWLKPQNKFYHSDYICLRNDRIKRDHGGVMILVKTGINFTPLKSLNH